MTLKLQDEGLKNIQEACRTAWNATALKLHLYSNNVTPTTSSIIGDFTECTFAGYAAANVITWGAAAVAAHVSTIQAAALTFARSTTGAPQNIYGYYVTDAAGTFLYWAERDSSAPVIVTNAGDSYTVTLKQTNQDLST